MSDEEATKKEQEEAEAKKKVEEATKRLWIIQLVRDPEGLGGATVVQPLQNVQKQWQVDMMLAQATNQQELTKTSRSIVELLKAVGVIKTKKGIFKGR